MLLLTHLEVILWHLLSLIDLSFVILYHNFIVSVFNVQLILDEIMCCLILIIYVFDPLGSGVLGNSADLLSLSHLLLAHRRLRISKRIINICHNHFNLTRSSAIDLTLCSCHARHDLRCLTQIHFLASILLTQLLFGLLELLLKHPVHVFSMLEFGLFLGLDCKVVEGAHGEGFAGLGVSLRHLFLPRTRPLPRILIHLPSRLVSSTPFPTESSKLLGPVIIVTCRPLFFQLRVFARLVNIICGFGRFESTRFVTFDFLLIIIF